MNHLTNHPLNCSTAQMLNFLPSHLYICRESSTNSPLFMQNKPNLLNAQMNVYFYLTKTCENNLCPGLLKNKPNSKPIKPKTNPIKPNTNPIQTQYEPNTNPIFTKNSAVFISQFYSIQPIPLLSSAILNSFLGQS